MQTRSFSTTYRLICITTLLAFSAIGCQGAKVTAQPYAPAQPDRAFVEGLRDAFDAPLRERADARASRGALEALLADAAKVPWKKRITTGIKYADILKKAYSERGYIKLSTRYDGLNPRGEAIVAAVSDWEKHLVSEPMDYHLARIKELDEAMSAQAAASDPWEPISLTGAEIAALVDFVRDKNLDHQDEAATKKAIIEALLGPADASPIPRINEQVTSYATKIAPSSEKSAELEVLTADAALRWARDIKHSNLSRLSWKQLKEAGGSKTLILKRLADFHAELAETPAEETAALMQGLLPPHPHYTALVNARQRYKAAADKGGFKRVGRVKLRSGHKAPQVKALRTRLQQEGYLPEPPADAQAPPADVVDKALLDAVHAYHKTHQLTPRATPTKTFWKSLNVSAKRRLAQIDLNIKRWREGRYGGEQDYIMVNLPEFQAMAYSKGVEKFRFNVVIGKNNRVCDPETQTWTYPNRTPTLMSKLEYFILNPSWYVPQRIVEEEIKPAVEEDETWLERHNYEIVKQRGETWTVRQNPGPDNALGLVKFIFPNPHNTYMHDTPKKQYFDYKIRAYSHGCMRVQDPLDFAKYLIAADGQSGQIDVPAIIESQRSKMVKMNKELPVFVEYFTVTVDHEDRPVFLYDVYKHDVREMSKSKKAFDRCNAPLPTDEDSPDETSAPADVGRDLGP